MHVIFLKTLLKGAYFLGSFWIPETEWLKWAALSLRKITFRHIQQGAGRVVRWCWVNFQCRGVLQFGYSRARAYCARSRCGWGLFGHFFSHLSFSPLSPSLWETARYRLKYCLKGPLNPKQPTNQHIQHQLT